MARAGDVVGGKYRLVHPLGIGGMGTVWRAEHLALQQQVAIKLLDARGPAAERAVKRFQREAQIAASIRHQNIVYISDFGTEGGAPYLVMELLSGVPLAERLVVGEPLSVGMFLRLMEETLQGLAAVHAAGVVHRDMKPENIFLVRDPKFAHGLEGALKPEHVFPKLLDFGVSRSTERNAGHTITREGIVMGTPEYVSPEQARGRMADVRSDIYSLGVVMYEALAGRLPFQADNAADLIVAVLNAVPIPLVSLRPDLGDALSDLIGKAMARQPEDRFQNTEEMRLAVLDLLELEPGLSSLSLPRRYMAAKSNADGESEERSSLDPIETAQTLSLGDDALHPTAAMPRLVTPLRGRVAALGFGALGLVLAITALAFVTTGGQPSPPARAAESPEVPSAPAAEPPPVVSKEVLVDLHGLPAGASVRVDGRPAIGNPLRLMRDSGSHQISIEAPGMLLWSVMHDSQADGRYAVSLEPENKPEKVRSTRAKKSKSGLLRRPDF